MPNKNNKKTNGKTSGRKTHINRVPIEVLGSYLSPKNLIALGQTSKEKFKTIAENTPSWKKIIKQLRGEQRALARRRHKAPTPSQVKRTENELIKLNKNIRNFNRLFQGQSLNNDTRKKILKNRQYKTKYFENLKRGLRGHEVQLNWWKKHKKLVHKMNYPYMYHLKHRPYTGRKSPAGSNN